MFVKKIKNRSGRTSVVVGLKDKGKFKRLATMGVSSDEDELSALVGRGNEWIADHMERTNPTIDFDGEKEYADKVVAVLYTGAEIENLTIVPNPTDGLFKVIASGSMAGGRIELLSQAGLVVRIVDIDSFDATIDISDLPSGIYVLRFITDTKVLQQKVVKY